MTSIEVPYSIAASLPTLSVLDITNEVERAVARAEQPHGIVYVTAPAGPWTVRVNEREAGFFCDLETMLNRLVPTDTPDRERMLLGLLGPRSEQVPFNHGRLTLGRWQKILLVGFDEAPGDWLLTVLA
ncbi:MAG: YjbQ family protein [Gaiellaceae bacterium]